MNEKLIRKAIGQQCVVCKNYILETDGWDKKIHCVDKKFFHKRCVDTKKTQEDK